MTESTQACHEGFDLDLYSWWPESKEVVARVGMMPLYTFGQVSESGRFVSATYWNGPGCLFFTEPPSLAEDRHGWRSFQGMVTKDEIVCVSVEHAIRYLFVQGYSSALDNRPWTNQNNIVLDLCGCVRGYAAGEVRWASVRERAKLWLTNAVHDVARTVAAL